MTAGNALTKELKLIASVAKTLKVMWLSTQKIKRQCTHVTYFKNCSILIINIINAGSFAMASKSASFFLSQLPLFLSYKGRTLNLLLLSEVWDALFLLASLSFSREKTLELVINVVKVKGIINVCNLSPFMTWKLRKRESN